jgi:alkylation response protein AidB-like acyl-CoA dehydrogenase
MSAATWAFAGRCRSVPPTAEITQIYEGTNQIQRVVMTRRLLK